MIEVRSSVMRSKLLTGRLSSTNFHQGQNSFAVTRNRVGAPQKIFRDFEMQRQQMLLTPA